MGKTLKNRILRELGSLSRIIHTKSDLKFKSYHLQKGQFVFLTRVCENPGINLIQLSHRLRVDKTTTTKAVQKLIDSGYFDKQKDDTDSRALRLYPTPRALEVYERLIEDENANIDLCFKGFTPAEIEATCQLINRMNTNLESVWHELKKGK